jgi:hypothetical protein
MVSASMPSSRSGVRSPLSGCSARVSISSTGVAAATPGATAARSYSASSTPERDALRSDRSGSPLAARTAAENSDSAELLIRWTEYASATPSATASSATAWRHG